MATLKFIFSLPLPVIPLQLQKQISPLPALTAGSPPACTQWLPAILQPYTPIAIIECTAAMVKHPLFFQLYKGIPHADYHFRAYIQSMMSRENLFDRKRSDCFQ